ncbi:hypothetical protein [Bartonella sp. F02]|uniref:hypothetical protein n=1 Tax=Bartonella sp. F02 TaxID=2967262 RepID=UPI0022A96774|nr:hypothetical protein [Bartonella sp. F02]MCZ2328896.1 hypothetical protein [Bartonella sp. F02]
MKRIILAAALFSMVSSMSAHALPKGNAGGWNANYIARNLAARDGLDESLISKIAALISPKTFYWNRYDVTPSEHNKLRDLGVKPVCNQLIVQSNGYAYRECFVK